MIGADEYAQRARGGQSAVVIVTVKVRCILRGRRDMGDVPPEDATGGEETPSREPSLFDKASVSAGGQIYTDTELGQYFYGGR